MRSDRSEILRLLANTERLAPPTPIRAGRIWRRDPRAEYDAFYLLDAGLQTYIRRRVMGNAGQGLPPDEVSTLAGYDDVSEWWADLVDACKLARDRSAADDWSGEYAAEDDLELIGPDELSDLLNVTRGAIRQWRRRGLLPRPDMTISSVPIWHLGTIRQWAADSGRTIEHAADVANLDNLAAEIADLAADVERFLTS
jgi:hypothetical protein